MKLNGHELESVYLSQIIELKRAKERPRVTDVFWVGTFKKKLRKRLVKLETDFDNGLVSEKAYAISKKMINEVL
jgi:hypothetical protein